MASLESILLDLLSPNTLTVRQGESHLVPFLKSKSSIMDLITLASSSSNANLRHFSFLLLRHRLPIFWQSLSKFQQEVIKEKSLFALGHDPNRLVRLHAAYVVGIVAKFIVNGGMPLWEDMMNEVWKLTNDIEVSWRREIGFMALYSLAEVLGRQWTRELAELYVRVLREERDEAVMTACLRAVGAVIEVLAEEKQVEHFRLVVPEILRVLGNERLGDDVLTQVVESIGQLSDSPIPVLDPYVTQLVETLCGMLVSPDRSLTTKSAACVCLTEVINNKPRLAFQSQNSVQCVFQAMVALAREAALGYDVEPRPNMEDDMRPNEMLEIVADYVASRGSTQRVGEPLLVIIKDLMEVNQTPLDRVAGTIMLLVCTEGLKEILSGEGKWFPVFLNLLLASLNNPNNPTVTRSTLVCLGQWAEHLGCDITERHAEILPYAIRCMRDPTPRVRVAALYLLSVFCEEMDSTDLAEYTETLVPAVVDAVVSAQDPSAASDALETLACIAMTTEEKYAPFLRDSFTLGASLLNLTEERLVPARKSGIVLLSKLVIVAERCFPDGNNPYIGDIPEMLRRSFDIPVGFSSEVKDELLEAAYGMCGHISALGAPRMDELIPSLMMKVLEGCTVFDDDDVDHVVVDRDENVVVPEGLRNILALSSSIDGGHHDDQEQQQQQDDDDDSDLLNDDENEEFVPGRRHLTSIRTGAIDLKVAMLFALESMVEAGTPSLCAEFFPQISQVVEKTMKYPHHAVRSQGLGVLVAALIPVFKSSVSRAFPPPPDAVLRGFALCTHTETDLDLKWMPGALIPNVVDENNLYFTALAKQVHPLLHDAIVLDPNKEVAAAACDGLVALLREIGPCAVPGRSAEAFVYDLIQVFLGKAACQSEDEELDTQQQQHQHHNNGGVKMDDDDDDEEEGDGDRRHDDVLIDSVSDALAMLVKVMAKHFVPLVPSVIPVLLKYVNPSMPPRDRLTGLGCLCQIVHGLTWEGAAAASLVSFAPKMYKVAMQAMRSKSDPLSRRNATFLLGVMATAELLNPTQALEALGSVRKAFDEASEDKYSTKWDHANRMAVMDNACGAVARLTAYLIRVGALTPDRIEVIARGLVSCLPIREDHQEDWICYDVLSSLFPLVSPSCREQISSLAQRVLTADPEGFEIVTTNLLNRLRMPM